MNRARESLLIAAICLAIVVALNIIAVRNTETPEPTRTPVPTFTIQERVDERIQAAQEAWAQEQEEKWLATKAAKEVMPGNN